MQRKKWFIGNFYKLTDTKYQAMLLTVLHDSLPEEVINKGIFLDELPYNDSSETKIDVGIFYNPLTGDVWREYEENKNPPTYIDSYTEITSLKSENESLKRSQSEQDSLIMQIMLGGVTL